MMPKGPPLAWAAGAILAASMAKVSSARADATLGSGEEAFATARHRISGAIQFAMVDNNFWSNLGQQSSKGDLQLRGAYGYRVLTGLELGGSVGYWAGVYTKGFVSSFRLRPYFSPSTDVELGANLELGIFMRPGSTGTPRGWIGQAWSIGPNARKWFGAVGVEGSINASEGCVRGSYPTGPSNDCFVAVGAELGVVGRL
jgi:hypothetical protein